MLNSVEQYTETGDSYKDCVEKIREKYGDSYIIINKRECYTGRLFNKKKQMEVVYTVRDISPAYRNSGVGIKREDSLAIEKEKLIVAAQKASIESQQLQMVGIQKQLESLNRKLDVISPEGDVPPVVKKIEDILETNEFTASYIRKITERIRSEFSLDDLEDFALVQSRVVEWIGESIQIEKLSELEKRPTILILVGPTGVGKTTTVAKMAAKFRLSDKNLFIRMVTIDRFRIAAQEQLSIYGEHMEIPTTAAESADDIQKLLAIDSGKLDLMLIDTIGLSPHDYESIGRMRKILDIPSVKPDVYLVVSASTKASDLRDIMRNYEPFDYKSVIVTKYDETNHIGNVVSVLSEKNKPVAFISSGQIVPRNLEVASVVRFLLKLTDLKIDRDSLEKKFSALPEDFTVVQSKNIDGSAL